MRAGRLVALVLAAAAAAAGAAGCRRASEGGAAAGLSVVLVSIDTLRADRLALYGYAQGSTPTFDRLGREGVVFDEAYSHCPLTLPAHSSLLTGLLPPQHGVRDNLGFTLRTPRTLAARFKAAGFKTGGAVSAFVLRKETGIAQGFDLWDDQIEVGNSPLTAARDGAVAVQSLGRWIEAQGDARFFAFLHLYEPHAPYTPPERHRRADPYDGEVSYADELLGRLLDRLQARGLSSRVLLAVTADHGEGLQDHGEQEHGVFLYRETMRIPLVLRWPNGAHAGTRVRGPVAQVDIPATLLDLAGVPQDAMTGVSLRSAVETGRVPDRPVYAETFYPRFHFGWSELLAATETRYRYVRAPRPELYDVATDPGERNNRVGEKADVAGAMDAWLDAQAGTGPPPVPGEVAPEARERLEALGYVGLGAGRAQEKMNALTASALLPDPKDKIGVYESLRQALVAKAAGRWEEAAGGLRKIVAASPRLPEAWEALGETLVRLDRPREGTAALEHALALDPERLTTMMALAGSLAEADRAKEALDLYRKADALRRTRGLGELQGLHSGAGDCLARRGPLAAAERELRAEVDAFPASVEARVRLAALYRALGRRSEARAALVGLAAAPLPADPEAYATILGALQDLDDPAAASDWTRRAHTLFPVDPRFK
jgi:arylsulfatase A-like enzyme/Flp pilus assembly protein TadD